MLIGAGRRLAKHLARIRTGDEEPAPADLRAAMRDVVRHCLYGVDVNDMAVELCKVALWMETMEPGKPLSFLDAHIQCGNSLIGVTPGLDISEIPDDAFQPVTGDDRTTATGLRRRNKKEREGQLAMHFGPPETTGSTERHAGKRAAMVAAIEDLAEEDVAAVAAKARSYDEYLQSTEYKWARWEADTWTAAFFWPIPQGDAGTLPAPTQDVLRAVRAGKLKQHEALLRDVRHIARQRQFFHWSLQFPDVFERENGGFDVMLMNPPWERIRPEADKFFAVAAPEVLAKKQTDRNKQIEELANSAPQLYEAWKDLRRTVLLLTSYLKYSSKFPLSTTKNVNSYAVFQELALGLISASGRSGLIVQSGIATDDINRPIFDFMISEQRLVTLYDFENRNGLFPGVRRMMRFCLVTTTGSTWHQNPAFVAYATEIEDVVQRLQEKRYSLSQNDIRTLSPNTGLLPMFRNINDAGLTLRIYRTSGVLIDERAEGGNPWSVSIRRLFSIYYDSERLVDASGLGFSPTESVRENEHWARLYEAKLFHQYDHRYASYIGSSKSHLKCEQRGDLARSPILSSLPRYWLPESELQAKLDTFDRELRYFLGFRDVTNASNERTCIASVIPRCAPDDTIRLILTSENSLPSTLLLVANLNSFVLDFAARCTVASTHLSEYIARELPVLSPAKYRIDDVNFVSSRVLELTYTAWDLQPFARDCGYDGPPFRWDEDRRFLLRCELDAAYFHLYGIERDDVDYILETFPIVKRKDIAKHGEFRTKRVILEIYDAMAEAMQGGAPYATRLEPPPADRRVAHGR